MTLREMLNFKTFVWTLGSCMRCFYYCASNLVVWPGWLYLATLFLLWLHPNMAGVSSVLLATGVDLLGYGLEILYAPELA